MTQLRVSGPARRDIGRVLRHSRMEFGQEAADRYRALLDRGLRDLTDDPGRPGVRNIDEVREGYRAFHLKFSRDRTSGPTVRHPRHVIVFRIDRDGAVLVARVFHERQLLDRHLDDEGE